MGAEVPLILGWPGQTQILGATRRPVSLGDAPTCDCGYSIARGRLRRGVGDPSVATE
jgi:hypothetical protein